MKFKYLRTVSRIIHLNWPTIQVGPFKLNGLSLWFIISVRNNFETLLCQIHRVDNLAQARILSGIISEKNDVGDEFWSIFKTGCSIPFLRNHVRRAFFQGQCPR